MMRKVLSCAVFAAAAAFCCSASGVGIYDPLFRVMKFTGAVQVLRPGESVPVSVREGQAYPYGSKVIVPKADPESPGVVPEATLYFSRDHQSRLLAGTQVSASLSGAGTDSEMLVLDVISGKVQVSSSVSAVKTGSEESDAAVEKVLNSFKVVTPLVTCRRLTDRTRIVVKDAEDGLKSVVVATESGTVMIDGPQFEIVKIRSNTTIDFLGDADFTRFGCSVGQMVFRVERGGGAREQISFKPGAVCKIWRLYADVGSKMAVSVMLVYPNGKISSFAYLDGASAAADSISGIGVVSSAQTEASLRGGEGADADEFDFDDDEEESGSSSGGEGDLFGDSASSDSETSDAADSASGSEISAEEEDDLFGDFGDW